MSARAAAALASVASIPRDAEGPVFREPWEAQAFAMAVALHARGLFSWPEWAQALAEAIRQESAPGASTAEDGYFGHWLTALERIVVAKGATDAHTLLARVEAWDRAARATPHGAPILLENDPQAHRS